MNLNAAAPRVILRSCSTYDAERIREIARDGLRELGLLPSGRTLVKPNIVMAGPRFPHAHTRPELAEGLLRAMQDVGGSTMTELAVGERCGITMPTRHAFAHSGFDRMLARLPRVRRYCFEEVPQVEIRYEHAGRLRDYVFVPEPVARADFFVNAPKFKAHPWTTVTFSMKNYIGLQDDRHRLIDHDHRLNEKVADLQHVIQPQFICIDAIIAGAALPPDFAFVIKKEMVRVPLAGLLLRRLGSEFVERFDRHKSAADTRRILRLAASGQSLVFFPEGTFDERRQIRRFMGGAFAIADRSGMPVVAVALHGAREVMPPGGLMIYRRPVLVDILTVLEPAGARQRSRELIAAAVGEPLAP